MTIESVTEEEVVENIADALKPWSPQMRQIETGKRAGEMKAKSKAELQADICQTVRSEIARLKKTIVPDFFGRAAIRKTRDDAGDIIKSIDCLEAQLSARALSPELRMRLGLQTSRFATPADLADMPVPRLLDALKNVRDFCRAAEDNQPRNDQVKLWCVRIALRLMLQFSAKRPSAGSSHSSYCTIAGLLYQSVTGNKRQLRRICQDVLKPYQTLLPS